MERDWQSWRSPRTDGCLEHSLSRGRFRRKVVDIGVQCAIQSVVPRKLCAAIRAPFQMSTDGGLMRRVEIWIILPQLRKELGNFAAFGSERLHSAHHLRPFGVADDPDGFCAWYTVSRRRFARPTRLLIA